MKERSLEYLNALFNKMLSDSTIPPELFERMKRHTFYEVKQYYGRMVGIDFLDGHDPTIMEEVRDVIGDTEIKKQHEANEPLKILRHSKLILEELEREYDAIVNILFGGAELGFALESLSEIYGKPIDCPIVFVRYSMYDGNDRRILVPDQLLHTIPENKRILIMDDSVGTGRTLRKVKHFFEYLGNDVDMTATEISYDYLADIDHGNKKGDKIELGELSYESGLNYRKR